MFNCTPGLVLSPINRRVSTSGPLYYGYSEFSKKSCSRALTPACGALTLTKTTFAFQNPSRVDSSVKGKKEFAPKHKLIPLQADPNCDGRHE